MGTDNYNLPLINGADSVKVPRDFNALSESIDALLKGRLDAVGVELLQKADASSIYSVLSTKADAGYVDSVVQSIASGAPKAKYDTLAALQAAKPTGDANIYLVVADGKWYFWSGSAWTAGGVYQAVQVATGVQKLNILKSEYLDKDEYRSTSADTLIGFGFSGTTSTIVSSSGSLITNFIKMDVGDSLTATINGVSIFDIAVNNYANNKLAVYDANKNWVSTTNTKNLTAFTATAEGYIRLQTTKDNPPYISTGRPLLKPDAINLVNSQDLSVFKNSLLTKTNLFDSNSSDYLVGKGYSGTTGTIVSATNNYITNYIELKIGERLDLKINGISVFDPACLNYATNKMAVYDANKTWVNTNNSKNYTSYTATSNVFIRFMGVVGQTNVTINTSGQPMILKKDYVELPASSTAKKMVDLGIFMGQSNMAGRGVAAEAPVVPTGQAYEFRAISNPNLLLPLVEPFGYYENSTATDAINDSSAKTGSMVSALAIEQFKITGIPLVAVSASQGSTGIDVWQPNTPKLNDAIARLNTARTWLLNNGYTIRRTYMAWCQGEADFAMPQADYKTKLEALVATMVAQGVEKCFVIRIGEHNSGAGTTYDSIIQAQTDLAKISPNIVLVGTKFAEMRLQGLMKDTSHYFQPGYNIQGKQAGINIANHLQNQKEPIIYDSKYSNLYYSTKL